MRVMCFENRRGYMEKRLFIFVLMCFAIITSCDLLGLGEEKGAPQIKDFTWKIDTLHFPNLMFDLNISGEYLNDLWLVNRYWESGLIKVIDNGVYISNSIEFLSNVKYFNGNFYAGGGGGLKRLTFSKDFKTKVIEKVLDIDRGDLNYNFGLVSDMVVARDGLLYVLCSFDSEDSLPSYTTVMKWDGNIAELVYTSAWGVQGQKLIEGENGIFFKGFKSEYEGTFVMREFDVVVGVQADIGELFIVANQQRDYLSLGKIGDEVFLKYNEDLFALNDGNMIPTGIRFPENTFGFTGYSKNNLLATGVSGYFVYDGASWEQLPLPINTNTENRIGEPLLMRDGIVNVITQRPLSSTFYLVRGSPK
jgi:hypothetical protein